MVERMSDDREKVRPVVIVGLVLKHDRCQSLLQGLVHAFNRSVRPRAVRCGELV